VKIHPFTGSTWARARETKQYNQLTRTKVTKPHYFSYLDRSPL